MTTCDVSFIARPGFGQREPQRCNVNRSRRSVSGVACGRVPARQPHLGDRDARGVARCWSALVRWLAAVLDLDHEVDAARVRRYRLGASLPDSVAARGSLFHLDGTLRQALDAALSSPSAVGVAVDNAGKVVGGVLATDVLAVLESQRRG